MRRIPPCPPHSFGNGMLKFSGTDMQIFSLVLRPSRVVVRYLGGIFAENVGLSLVLLVVYSALLNALIVVPVRIIFISFGASFLIVKFSLLVVGAMLLILWATNLLFVFYSILVFLLGAISSRNERAPSLGWLYFQKFLSRNKELLQRGERE